MVLYSEETLNYIFEIAYQIAAEIEHLPNVVISSGSGYNRFWDDFNVLQKIPYKRIPSLPTISVEGHSNELLVIEHNQKIALVFNGRFHLYEGHPLEYILIPIVIPYLYGIHNYVYFNAAGGLNPKLKVGDIMLITDLINFTSRKIVHLFDKRIFGVNNLAQNVISTNWLSDFENLLVQNSIKYEKGTYVQVTGPSYETPAEVRFLRRIKGDAVGMSTALELLAGNLLGVNQIAISVITNTLTETISKQNTHDDVLNSIYDNEEKIKKLIKYAIESSPDEIKLL